MIALAIGLSFVVVYRAPFGGSVTAASMLPLLVIAYRHGTMQGILSGVVYALIHMLVKGFYPPPVETIVNFLLVICLDYVFAYGVLGLAKSFIISVNIETPIKLQTDLVSQSPFPRGWQKFARANFCRGFNKQVSVVISCLIVMFLRFLCHYISGIIIWAVYAPDGQSPYIYSLLYNGSYMFFEAIITIIALVALVTAAPQLFENINKKAKSITS
jgi:thiamine transporter